MQRRRQGATGRVVWAAGPSLTCPLGAADPDFHVKLAIAKGTLAMMRMMMFGVACSMKADEEGDYDEGGDS